MRLLRQLPLNLTTKSPSVITLGNFDGIHRGHQWLIHQTVDFAKKHHCRSVLLTFDPMPSEFFSPQNPPARLMRFIEKWDVLQDFALDDVCVLSFANTLAIMSAQEFIEKILVGKFQVKHIFVGDDFRFGFQRRGDVTLLRQQGEKYGFGVTTHTETTVIKNSALAHVETSGLLPSQIISSTLVRDALKTGDFALAEQLLGRAYKNIGRVVHGSQLGRELGCPTANIPMQRTVSPVHGVYVVKVVHEGFWHYGVASVGNRPAVGGHPEVLLEVHLFDFNGDLYGKRLEVTYLKKLRDEWMFDSLSALKVQIEKDCIAARAHIRYICTQNFS